MTRLFLSSVLGVMFAAIAFGQETPKPVVTPTLQAGDDAFISRQQQAFLDEVSRTLEACPPAYPEPRERTLALRLIDAVLHDTHSPNREPVQQFFHARISQAADQIENTRVTEGLRIWKIYNHGFVVRTPSITVAFDLHRGAAKFRWDKPDGTRERVDSPNFPFSVELAERIVKQCDVLFISHEHGDHADPAVVELFIKQGKPVVAPDGVLKSTPLHESITHLKRDAHTIQKLPIQNGARELEVVVYPGQQYQSGGVENNVTLVISPEGYSFAHNGDQINDPYPEYQKDFEWIDAVKEHHRVDVLITNCWTNDLLRMVRGFNPQLVIPGHENELGHQMNDRVPYWMDESYLGLNFSQVKAEYPTIPLAWGESYAFVPKR
ncbi:MAG: MBL fold metallo-hydrolase [Candidatus Hydrogenedentes bacterium]|nr:MBL fold metallo-hydrolase [Candidatus Hydrogenedentota bacterium]